MGIIHYPMDKAALSPRLKGRELSTRSRLDAVRERVRMVAQEAGAGARLPSVTQFCRELGISPNTLDKALGTLEAEGIVERRNGVGLFVGSGVVARQGEIALVCRLSFLRAPGHSPVWDALVSMLSERAQTSGWEFEASFARDTFDKFEEVSPELLSPSLRRAVKEGHVAGVLGVGLPNGAARWLMEQGVPVVTLYGGGHVVVKTEAAQHIRLCVEGLRARNCLRLALWMGVHPFSPAAFQQAEHRENQMAFVEASVENGLRLFPDLIEYSEGLPRRNGASAPTLAEQGYETAKRVFSKPRIEWPDGVVILDDNMAHGALVALRQLGVEPGRDVRIAAGANAGSPLQLDSDNLLLAEVSIAEIVDTMFNRLERLLRLLPDEQEVITIPARLRETTFSSL